MKSSPLSIGLDDCWVTWRIGDTATAAAHTAEDPRVGDDHFADVRTTIEEHDAAVARVPGALFAVVWTPQGLPLGHGFVSSAVWPLAAAPSIDALVALLQDYKRERREKVFDFAAGEAGEFTLGPTAITMLVNSTKTDRTVSTTVALSTIAPSTEVVTTSVATYANDRAEDLVADIGPLVATYAWMTG